MLWWRTERISIGSSTISCRYRVILRGITLELYHRGNPHGGIVLRKGRTGAEAEHEALYEFKLKLDSNPEFTASVMLCYARAVYRLAAEGATGCRTILDIPIAYAFPGEREALLHTLL